MSDFIGPFELRGRLGQGAMATVWRAYDPSLDREVAIKQPKLPVDASDETQSEFAERFVREARTAARLNHPGIVTIYSAAVYDDEPVIVMELIDGPTLRQVLRSTTLTPRQAFALMDQLLQSVGYAHEHGVTHRDLKPDNVFITHDGTVKLADFGIAHIDSTRTLTQAGSALGTPAYMAPEQILGRETDARVDVFALGSIAYESLSGSNPFGGSSSTHFATIVHRIMSEPTPPLELGDALAGPLSGVIMRALRKEPENRFENAVAMLSAWRSAYPASINTKAELAQIVTPVPTVAAAAPEPMKTENWGVGGISALTGATESQEVGVLEAAASEAAGRKHDKPTGPSSDREDSAVTPADSLSIAGKPAAEGEPVGRGMSTSRRRRPRTLVVAAAVVVVFMIGVPLLAMSIGRDDRRTEIHESQRPAVAIVATESVETTVPPPTPLLEVKLKAVSSRKVVTKGQRFKLAVSMRPSDAVKNGTSVLLQRRYGGGKWVKIRRLKLVQGKASFATTLSRNAYFRFVFEGNDGAASAKSNRVLVNYKKPVVRTSSPPAQTSPRSPSPSPPPPPPPPPPPS